MGLLEEINQKLDNLSQRIQNMESIKHTPSRIPLRDFCDERKITRPTAYAWNDRGLIVLEKIAGRQYVLSNSITIAKKYQRQPETA